jgi:hypothetical protein
MLSIILNLLVKKKSYPDMYRLQVVEQLKKKICMISHGFII